MNAPLDQLAMAQSLLRALVEDADEATYRHQAHPDLSALGWHLGHCVYIECHWLHRQVRGDASLAAPLERLYTPPLTPKPERGSLLPPRTQLLAWAEQTQAATVDLLAAPQAPWAGHPLLVDDYLTHFLLQHHSQHYETMLMVLTQHALARGDADHQVQQPIAPSAPARDTRALPAGHYRIGGEPPQACDNELPPQRAELGPFAIARRPVSNAEYLGFMSDGGYRRPEFWSAAGWTWREAAGAGHPEHWRQDRDGNWYGIGVRGAYDLTADEPVLGISHHEAEACAAWAGARLPHEYQWEAACRAGLLADTGRAWEWCANTFHPYAGFSAFPYDEYSSPWFGGDHHTLRGGSLYTRPAIRRPSFRNFYEPAKRHIFAGLRLVY